MANLDQVIYAHPGADNRIAARPAINAAGRANFGTIANDHPAKLRHGDMFALGIGNETKAFIANPRTGVKHHPGPGDAIHHAGMGMDTRMRPKLAAGTNRTVMFQNGVRANLRPRPDENKGANFTPGANNRVLSDDRCCVNTGLWLSQRVEQSCDTDEIGLRRCDNNG
jgi:hypothetical protein